MKVRAALLALALTLGAAQSQSLRQVELQVQGVAVAGAELDGVPYVVASRLPPAFAVGVSGNVARVDYRGSTALLLIEDRAAFALLADNPVQAGGERITGRAATRAASGELLLPLETLAAALGGEAEGGALRIPGPRVLAVAAVAQPRSDRLVLDLSRPAELRSAVQNGALVLRLSGAASDVRAGTYQTRGAFVPSFQVIPYGGDVLLRLPLQPGWGYRSYLTPRGAVTRLSVDVGPGVPALNPALSRAAERPAVLLLAPPGGPAHAVARQTASLLWRAGWQVELTDSASVTPAQVRRAAAAVQLSVAGQGAGGVQIFSADGRSRSRVVNVLRERPLPNSAAVVAPADASRAMGGALQSEFARAGLRAAHGPGRRLWLLREAPGAALVLHLGSLQDAADAARLASGPAQEATALALARTVSRSLTAPAAGASAPQPAGGQP